LNTFALTGFSIQWTGYGPATNLLPANNPDASTSIFQDAADGSGSYIAPYWVSFDLGSSVEVLAFEYKSIGDTTHDPNSFQLETSTSATGTYTPVGAFNGVTGNSLQVFALSTPITAQYWKFNILSTHSSYQPCVAYVNFIIGTGSPPSSGPIYSPSYGSYLNEAGNPYMTASSENIWTINYVGNNLYSISNSGLYLSAKIGDSYAYYYSSDPASSSYNQFTFTKQVDGSWYIFSPYSQTLYGAGYLCVGEVPSGPVCPTYCEYPLSFTFPPHFVPSTS